MSESMLLRPGLVAGRYPERADERVAALDRLMAALAGRLRQLWLARGGRNRGFIARVQRAEAQFTGLSDPELAQERARITSGLRSGNLSDARVAEAFGFIREVSGRTLGLRHFDVQLLGGRILLKGRIAEMETGEGKTLTATLAAAVMALAGVPVHVVTVNDYLAQRDATWMGPLYRALGLSVGVIVEDLSTDARRAAYACHVTYCSNKQLAFDYLKDRLILDQETRPLHMAIEGLCKPTPRSSQVMMRGLCFAIIDEADSVLIDEARTPLIITRPGSLAGLEATYTRAIQLARSLESPRDFAVRERDWKVQLTDIGKAQIRRLSRQWGGVWVTEAHREELCLQAIAALHLYQRDKHYLVTSGQVQIVDEYTGRVMGDRSWERGLHQMIEVKEGCEISGRQETLIRISYQRFFRRYIRLAGMTGTAREVAAELSSVYRLDTRRVPTNRPTRRRSEGEICFARAAQKWPAVVQRVAATHATGRPVLIATRSVAASEHLSALLLEAGLEHRVLNAREDEFEADIVARAGQLGHITVATNMAGRGTDIALGDGVREIGGLHVICTERHDAGRIDRQLHGRCGRQGDPGSYITIVSLEDDLMRLFYGQRIARLARLFEGGQGRVPAIVARPLTRLAQHSAEWRHSAIRRNLLRADDGLEDLLAFSGRGE